ncbi:tRNA (guanosine(46)-N7)-methyltransferase TrmB [Nocardioides sp. zg-536]|uniref:tRNA (guanine-N(7)-)-methyltransferase n=1 Tax=Nocardioides faecalis TaxID=2803858 RepID=A0A939BYC5_9ACTN|nr:tRNA (guanosine(46)-N7)-methyltransferase TrmB [Nocardioides faecalis]MBM9459790.1 tRNA (guanosine(46)-N7)-methyltransferase TrmB [Nocardioides faecalis]MBS4753432.1 tRNA (guanosine(46)-N7)-methyltransferase TrmB [Nocardioides faecalis]QVI58301.1 tRNA (guanosine(46)-N7)-methyltransferase TrmB [Nocardioides faecalis]
MNHGVRPARPHLKLTEDGRSLREVLTYARRGSRLTSPRQQRGWEQHAEEWVIPDEAVDAEDFSFAQWFGREAPMIVEIGGGVGEATAALAAARPSYNVLSLEVWIPGVAESMWRVGEAGASNVRFCSVDAVWTFEHLLAESSLSEVWTFFPDPWHKSRHHKRRLVNAENAALIASRLEPGGLWRLATDWAEYAEQMAEVLDAEPLLEGGRVERWAERPVTKFERKGLAKDRDIADFAYRRV